MPRSPYIHTINNHKCNLNGEQAGAFYGSNLRQLHDSYHDRRKKLRCSGVMDFYGSRPGHASILFLLANHIRAGLVWWELRICAKFRFGSDPCNNTSKIYPVSSECVFHRSCIRSWPPYSGDGRNKRFGDSLVWGSARSLHLAYEKPICSLPVETIRKEFVFISH